MNIEPLKFRIAPAAVFPYTDFDGDNVTIATSKGTNAQLAAILTFGSANPNDPRELWKIDFSADAVFDGTTLTITAKRVGGTAENAGLIFSGSAGIAKVTVGGSIVGGIGQFSGRVHSAGAMASLTIGGSIAGSTGVNSSIVAGVSTPAPILGTSVKLTGAGVKDNLDVNGAVSKIASAVIKGSAFGTATTNDTITFAIAAQHLGKLTVGGTNIPRTPGASNDPLSLATKFGATRGATTDGFDFHAFEV